MFNPEVASWPGTLLESRQQTLHECTEPSIHKDGLPSDARGAAAGQEGSSLAHLLHSHAPPQRALGCCSFSELLQEGEGRGVEERERGGGGRGSL
jgi:hypothetical protein